MSDLAKVVTVSGVQVVMVELRPAQEVIVEKFTITIKYVILVTINKTTQRIVLIYWRRTTTFTVVESPQPIESTTPVVLEQQVNPDGSKTIISNSYVQVKTVDVKV